MSSWFMAHLTDILEHAATGATNVTHEDARYFLERFGEELFGCECFHV